VPPVNRSTGWPFHCAPFHRPESSETGFSPRPESGGFRSAFAFSGPCFIRQIPEIRGSILLGCGWPRWAFPRQKQSLQKTSKNPVDKN
jgi:hypothetical protein